MKFALVILGCLVTTTAAFTTDSSYSGGPSSECGDYYYYGPSGVISSPNFPYYYDNNLYCNYYIFASSEATLSFVFRAFNTESNYDYVTISCPSNTSFDPQRFSGGSLPTSISIEYCSQGLVVFTSDGSVIATGFNLDYYVSEGGCGNTAYSDSYGYVTSPDYPNYYGYYQDCYNTIWASKQSDISIQFQYFELEYDCNRDWLEISCIVGSPYGPYRYCGYNSGYSYYIFGCSQLLLWFHSDGSNVFPGFQLQYNVYSIEGEYTTGYADVTTGSIDQVCGESAYYDPYGIIRSPNYPGYYGNYLYCDYYVYATTGSSLSFIFNSFHVENSNDFVTISCNSNSNFPPQEYTGDVLPEPVSISPCSQGRVNFRTDYTGVSSGFSLDYYVSDAGCGTTVYTGNNGFVNSPNWPEFYGYNKNCSNIIWAPHQSTIQLNFQSFSLPNDCNADWLEISCLDNSEYDPKRLCGNYDDKYEIYIQRCSQILLWFHSDDSSNAQGFVIKYTIYPTEACGGLSYFGPSGNISSPNYPGDYYDFLYCDYTIYASPGNSLLFTFDSFHVEDGYDFLTISCPANSSYYEYELSGDYKPSPISIPNCSRGLVNFHTDETIVSTGFSLKYFVNTAGCGTADYYPYNGYVTSPNWPSTYGYNQDCHSVIYSYYEESTFYLNFQSFILHSCCSCDWLEISCLDNPDFSPTRYCGSYPPFDTYINNCSQVLLWFHSDGSGNDQGFNIEYSVYSNADEGGVFNNGTSNVTRHVPSKAPVKAARKAPKNKTLNVAHNLPNYRKPIVAQHVPRNEKPHAAENFPKTGKPLSAENDHRNGKPIPAQNVASNGRPLAAKHVPRNGKPPAAQNAPSYGKPLSAQHAPINRRLLAGENDNRNEIPLAAQNVASNGKPAAEEKMKTK
jgi:hypothetical protein